MTDRFTNELKKLQVPKTAGLLVAVSGGIDSVVLCDLCNAAGYSFAVAHCNFQLRGEESERDEKFVRSLATKYGVGLFVKKFDTQKFAEEKKISIQEAARELRYQYFKEVIEASGSALSYLLTAHHADDNAETMLMNFCRGTGLRGLTGIPASTGNIRRPLLDFKREEIEEYATANQLEFVDDSSNSSDKYTRNHFRLNVIPSIKKVYSSVISNLNDNAARFNEIEKLYDLAVGKIITKISKVKGSEIHIPVKQLMEFDNRALIYALISRYGFTEGQVEEVIKLSKSESGRFLISTDQNFRIIRHRHWFIISPVQSEEVEIIVIEKSGGDITYKDGILSLDVTKSAKLSQAETNRNNDIAFLDARSISFPLVLRKWKQGDYFYPLGMTKKKKLSRFFIDQKLSKTAKENIWVIEMNKVIIWVVGHRIDERFKVKENSTSVLKITSSPLT